MSWNVVLNRFVEIKQKAAQKCPDIWDYDPAAQTCLEYWISVLGDEKYAELLPFLVLTEYGDLMLIKYGSFADLAQSELLREKGENPLEVFWDIEDGFFRECRSLVINIRKDELVLTPFRKFRNLNESEETSYEAVSERIRRASCVEFSNKLDGSMQSARYYDGRIVMAGSQALDRGNSWRLDDGYNMMMSNPGCQKMLMDHPDETFIFEYISRRDAHVVKYDKEGLFLVGMRDVNTGAESSYREVLECAGKYGVLTTEVYDKTLDEVVGELDSKLSSEAEGFVLNIDGFKVKIKYNDYVSMHKLLEKFSSINVIIQSIADDSFDDLLSKVPEAYRDRILKVADYVFDYIRETNRRIDEAYESAPREDRKQFMVWVEKNVRYDIRGFVRAKYLGKPYNVIKKQTGYLKLKDMGVPDYKAFFEQSEE